MVKKTFKRDLFDLEVKTMEALYNTSVLKTNDETQHLGYVSVSLYT
jgi:hypothetical protein